MIPVARTKQLLTQEIGDEIVIYDQTNSASHCLTPVAARVWHYCNGQNTIEEVTQLIKQDFELSNSDSVDMRGLVYLAVDELEQFNLIDRYLQKPQKPIATSRRKVIKTSMLAGGVAVGTMFPLIKSIIAPEPASASSSSVVTPGKSFVCSCGTGLDVKTVTKQCPVTSVPPVCDCTDISTPRIIC